MKPRSQRSGKTVVGIRTNQYGIVTTALAYDAVRPTIFSRRIDHVFDPCPTIRSTKLDVGVSGPMRLPVMPWSTSRVTKPRRWPWATKPGEPLYDTCCFTNHSRPTREPVKKTDCCRLAGKSVEVRIKEQRLKASGPADRDTSGRTSRRAEKRCGASLRPFYSATCGLAVPHSGQRSPAAPWGRGGRSRSSHRANSCGDERGLNL